jgi:hypothetical protein
VKKLLFILIFLIVAIGCDDEAKKSLEPILLADREAPIGWVYLRIYQDSTFEFESRGMRAGNIYSGNVSITNDTLFFHYIDSIPPAGTKAIITNKYVSYIDGKYAESVEIKLSTITVK